MFASLESITGNAVNSGNIVNPAATAAATDVPREPHSSHDTLREASKRFRLYLQKKFNLFAFPDSTSTSRSSGNSNIALSPAPVPASTGVTDNTCATSANSNTTQHRQSTKVTQEMLAQLFLYEEEEEMPVVVMEPQPEAAAAAEAEAEAEAGMDIIQHSALAAPAVAGNTPTNPGASAAAGVAQEQAGRYSWRYPLLFDEMCRFNSLASAAKIKVAIDASVDASADAADTTMGTVKVSDRDRDRDRDGFFSAVQVGARGGEDMIMTAMRVLQGAVADGDAGTETGVQMEAEAEQQMQRGPEQGQGQLLSEARRFVEEEGHR